MLLLNEFYMHFHQRSLVQSINHVHVSFIRTLVGDIPLCKHLSRINQYLTCSPLSYTFNSQVRQLELKAKSSCPPPLIMKLFTCAKYEFYVTLSIYLSIYLSIFRFHHLSWLILSFLFCHSFRYFV